jgi:hypothetical protein
MWLGAGELDKVRELVGAFTPDVLAALPRDSDWMLVLQCVAEGAVAVRDLEVTAGVVDLLGPYAGRSVVNAGAVMWHGVTDDTLARAHELLGVPGDGETLRARALATYDRIGARWWRDRLSRPTVPAASATRVVLLHEQPGGLWLVGSEGRTAVLPRMRGLEHLHVLLANPDTDVPALALVSGGEPTVEQAGLDLLDDTARRAYRARIVDLDRELELTDSAALREERAALVAQLAAAHGLGGRRRRSGANDERARVAVRKAIIGALARIAEHDPWLARHLHERVHTGHRCRYSSDPDHPVSWLLR